MYVNTFARVGERVRDEPTRLLRRRRAASARTATFATTPVSDDDVARASSTPRRYAPSAENRQPWEFVVVRDADARAAIGDLTRRAWEAHGRAFSEARLDAEDCSPTSTTARPAASRPRRCTSSCAPTSSAGSKQTVPSSIFPAVQNLLLAATALGLGSALTTITIGYRAELARAARAARSTSCPSRSSRSVIRRARSARPAATRSRRTRTASGTASVVRDAG